MAQVALAAVRDADSPVHESLQLDLLRHGGPDGPDLLQRRAAFHDDARKPGRGQKRSPFGRQVESLGRGVQGDRRQIHLRESHVLHDQRIHPRLISLPGALPGRLQLVVEQQRVHRHIHPGPEPMRIGGQLGDLLHAIPRRTPCPEPLCPDIHGIGSRPDRRPPHRRASRR